MVSAGAGHVMLTSDEMTWVAAPPTLPAGVKIGVIEGDPRAAGPWGTTDVDPADDPGVDAHGAQESRVISR